MTTITAIEEKHKLEEKISEMLIDFEKRLDLLIENIKLQNFYLTDKVKIIIGI